MYEIGPFDENYLTNDILIDLFDFETKTDFDRDAQTITYSISEINPEDFLESL
jgi:hypothetical protein